MNLWKLVLAAVFVFLFVGTVSAYGSNENAWVEFPFHNSCPAEDTSGNNRDGTCNSIGSMPVSGGISKSQGDWDYDDDGLHEYIDVGGGYLSLGTLSPSSGSGEDLSVSAWIYPETTGDQDVLISNANGKGGIMVSNGDGGSNKWWFYGDGGNARFDGLGDFSGSYSQWTHFVLTFDDSADEAEIYINGSLQETAGMTGVSIGDPNNDFRVGAQPDGSGNWDGHIQDLRVYEKELNSTEISNLDTYNCKDGNCPYNSAPSIDSTNHFPDPANFGDSISYTANASDADGDNLDAWISVEYWNNGTEFISDQPMTEPSTNNFKAEDLHTATVIEDGYNATIKVSDGNVNSTAEENFYLEDNSPGLVINRPLNKTYFDYDQTWRISNNDDGDALTGEVSTCNTWVDGNHLQTLNLAEGTTSNTFNFRNNLGFHTFNATCTELNGSALTTNKQKFFSVDNFQIQSNSSSGNRVYETVNETYSISVQIGDMVNNLDTTLHWNGFTDTKTREFSNTKTTVNRDHFQEIGLVANNNTARQWFFDSTVNYTELSGNTFNTETETEPNGTQNVWHSYYIQNQTLDKNKYLEQDKIKITSWLHNETNKANVEGDTFNNNTNTITDLSITGLGQKTSKYTGESDTKDIDQSSEAVLVTGNYTISFQGDTRSFSRTNKTVLRQINLQKCSQGGANALTFKSFQEQSLSTPQNTDLAMAVQVWNPADPAFKRTFNFTSNDQNIHEFCITPTDETFIVDSTQKLIEYEGVPNEDWVKRRYFLVNQSISDSETTVSLYTIWENQTNTVSFEVQDDDDQPVSQAITRIQRYFPGSDRFVNVAMIRTGSDGRSETELETGQVDYRFEVLLKQGKIYQLVETFPQQVIPNDLEVILTLGEDFVPGYYSYQDRFGQAGCTTNNSQVRCDWTAETESFDNVTLEVEQVQPIGFNTTCLKSGTTVSGTLICDGLNASENRYKYTFSTTFNNGDNFILENGWLGTVSDDYGGTGLILSLFIFTTLSFAGLWKPEVSIMLGLVAIVLSYVVGFLAVTQTALISILALGAVLVWRMNG